MTDREREDGAGMDRIPVVKDPEVTGWRPGSRGVDGYEAAKGPNGVVPVCGRR